MVCERQLNFTEIYPSRREWSRPHGIPIKVLTLQKGTCVFKGTPVKISNLINDTHFYVSDQQTAQIYVNRNRARPGYACTFQTKRDIKLVVIDTQLILNIKRRLNTTFPRNKEIENLLKIAYPNAITRKSFHEFNKAISSAFAELFSNYDGTFANRWPGSQGGMFHPEVVLFKGNNTLSPIVCRRQGQMQEIITSFTVTGINWNSSTSVKSKLLGIYDWVTGAKSAGYNLIRCADNQTWTMYDTNSSVTFIAEKWNWRNPNMPWEDIACEKSDDDEVRFSPCTVGNNQDRIFWKIPGGGLGELIVLLKQNKITTENLRAFLYIMKFHFGRRKVFNHNKDIHWLHFKTDDEQYKYDVIVRLILLDDRPFNYVLNNLSKYLKSNKDRILSDLANYIKDYAGQHTAQTKSRIIKILNFYGFDKIDREVYKNF